MIRPDKIRTSRRENVAIWCTHARESFCYWLKEGGFWRWLARIIGITLVGVWVWMIWGKFASDGASQDAGSKEMQALDTIAFGLVAFSCLVLGAVFLAPGIVPWVAGPLLRFVDAVYLGSHDVERPPLNYEVAERLVRERRWETAAGEFERIAYWHPLEKRAWQEAIRCSRLAGDEDGAIWLERRALRRCPAMRDPEGDG